MVENSETQYCYLNANNSDKLFNTFVSKRKDEKDSVNFVIVKQVGETASGQVYGNNKETTTVPRKEMPPRKKRKIGRSELESKLVSSRSTAKGFLQNRQMGKACKKNWDSDIPYIRNVFACLTV